MTSKDNSAGSFSAVFVWLGLSHYFIGIPVVKLLKWYIKKKDIVLVTLVTQFLTQQSGPVAERKESLILWIKDQTQSWTPLHVVTI